MDINLENDKLFKELEQTKKELSMAHSGYQYASSFILFNICVNLLCIAFI